MSEMVRGMKSVDMSDMREGPDWERLVEEVRTVREPQIIRSEGEDVAIIMPTKPAHSGRRRRRFSLEDSLFTIVGMAHSDGPGDVAENVDGYLAAASLPEDT